MPEGYDPGEPEGDEEELAEPARDTEFAAGGDGGYASLSGTRIERDPEALQGDEDREGADREADDALELTFEADDQGDEGGSANEDELLLDASRLADVDEPVQPGLGGRRRRMLGASADEGSDADGPPAPQRRSAAAPPTGGRTLFERMANLSRAASSRDDDEEEDEEESGGSLRIPRFLGRQNNQ